MYRILIIGIISFFFLLSFKNVPTGYEYQILERVEVEPAWSAGSVGFSLLTHENHQFVAYYDSARVMTIAHRMLDSDEWEYKKLHSIFNGWDGHNYVTMALDKTGNLHVSGNMHVNPLVYFRTDKPYEIKTLKQHFMTGENENRVTYPNFFTDLNNNLIFSYRDGGSGNGNNIYNIYDTTTKEWKKLFDQPLINGEGLRNAYAKVPIKGPDGWFHMSWIWRDTPAAETNHDLSYAKSPDLINWHTADGNPIELPITFETEGVIVDPVPVNQGIINGNGDIGFDLQNRPILSYHKFEDYSNSNSPTQLYNARLENGVWKIYQLTNWDMRFEIEGRGSLPSRGVSIGPVEIINGELRQRYSYAGHGSGVFVLDEETLLPIRTEDPLSWPNDISKVLSDYPNMRTRVVTDLNKTSSDEFYILRSEAPPANKDKPWPKPWAEPVMIEVYKLKLIIK